MNADQISESIRKLGWALMVQEVSDDLVRAQIYDPFSRLERVAMGHGRDQDEAIRAAYKSAIGREVTAVALELGVEP